MTKSASLAVGIALILGTGGLVYWQAASEGSALPPASTDGPAGSGTETGSNTEMNEAIAPAEIAGHKDRSSCWSSINGEVYDLTSWIPKHPGGEQVILRLCGTDGSSAFNRQHGGAAMQLQILAGFKIGTLAK